MAPSGSKEFARSTKLIESEPNRLLDRLNSCKGISSRTRSDFAAVFSRPSSRSGLRGDELARVVSSTREAQYTRECRRAACPTPHPQVGSAWVWDVHEETGSSRSATSGAGGLLRRDPSDATTLRSSSRTGACVSQLHRSARVFSITTRARPTRPGSPSTRRA